MRPSLLEVKRRTNEDPKGHPELGLTLIELVVAMSVFALIAVMGLQSLSGSLRLRDRLTNIADQAEALGQGVSLLRHDMQGAVPMLFYPAGRASPQSAMQVFAQQPGFSLSVSTEAESGAPLGRVEWRLDTDTNALIRRHWPSLYPASSSQVSPEVTVWQNVTGLRFRSYWNGAGWVDGLAIPSALGFSQVIQDADGGLVAVERYSDALPLGIEITVVTRDHGDIQLLESLK